jgi:hypothetical protein
MPAKGLLLYWLVWSPDKYGKGNILGKFAKAISAVGKSFDGCMDYALVRLKLVEFAHLADRAESFASVPVDRVASSGTRSN